MAREATRTRILAEAQDVVVEQGVGAVTMRGVAARVGVTPMALYRHFESRDALVGAIVEQAQDTFLHYLQRAMAERRPAARLLASGRQYLAFALGHPRWYAVLFMEDSGGRQAARGAAAPWQDAATFQFLVDRIRECAAAGLLSAADPEAAALTVWAHVHGLVSLHLAGKLPVGEARFRTIYASSLAHLLRGFGWTGPAVLDPAAG